jgi:hypothetical protein
MEIGKPKRSYTVEPLQSPVPRERPAPVPQEPLREREPEKATPA